MKPKEDDLIVFNDTKYGHVAIVTKVTDQYIEVIQQNVWGKSREKYKLVEKDNKYFVGEKHKPAGWLRKDEEQGEKDMSSTALKILGLPLCCYIMDVKVKD